jgi:GGDEF domain-containing protein
MGQERAKQSSNRTKTTLFRRIIVRLIFPLLFLIFAFTVIQLTNRMEIMNEFYKIESRIVFDTVQKKLLTGASQKTTPTEVLLLKTHLEKELSRAERRITIDLYDLLASEAISSDILPITWTLADEQAAEKSLNGQKNSIPYLVQVDKKNQRLFAYIPLQEGPESGQLWVARVLFPLAHLDDALRDSRWSLILMAFSILLTGFFMGRGLANTIVRPIKTLNLATRDILRGQLGKKVVITTGDEIELLAHTFNHMSESLRQMKQKAEDANPLTGLPGNQGIFDEIKNRIYEKQKFVVFHADLDRFKAFNDYYGLARGDEVIKQTATLLREALQKSGSKTDFVGHQGGDDFLLVLSPSHAKPVAEYVMAGFTNRIVKAFYKPEDFDRGYMLGVDRRAELAGDTGKTVQIPLMAISLAGISNAKLDFADYYDCLERAVKVKTEVKKIPGSCYIIQE